MSVETTVQPFDLVVFHAARCERLRIDFVSVEGLLVLRAFEDIGHASLFGHRDGVVDPQLDIRVLDTVSSSAAQRRNAFVPLLLLSLVITHILDLLLQITLSYDLVLLFDLSVCFLLGLQLCKNLLLNLVGFMLFVCMGFTE